MWALPAVAWVALPVAVLASAGLALIFGRGEKVGKWTRLAALWLAQPGAVPTSACLASTLTG